MRNGNIRRKPAVLAAALVLLALSYRADAAIPQDDASSRSLDASSADSLAAIESGTRTAMSQLGAAFQKRDAAAARSGSTAFLKSVEASRDLAAKLPPAARTQTACLRKVEMEAWTLSHLAATSSTLSGANGQLDVVRQAVADCDWPPVAPDSLSAAAASIEQAEALLHRQADVLGPGGSCSRGYTMKDMARDFETGKFDWGETQAIVGHGNYAVVRHFQFLALAAGTSDACAAFKPMEPIFVNDAMKSMRTNGMSCKGWVDEQLFVRAMTEKGPALESKCRDYLAQAYAYMAPGDDAKICGSLAANAGDPARFCRDLADDAYISPEKVEGCTEDFLRYEPIPEAACSGLNQQLYTEPRCQHRSAYARAREAGDISLCGNDSFCRALYSPQGAQAGADEWGRQAVDNTCIALKGRAQDKLQVALALLDQSSRFLAQPGRAGDPEARRLTRRIEDVRRQAVSLQGNLTVAQR